jgi:hypothetical protein
MMISMTKIQPFFLFVLVCFFLGCAGKKDEGPTKVMDYATKPVHGLLKKNVVGDVAFTCQYVPEGPLLEKGINIRPMKFFLSINTGSALLQDSVMYDYNYRSATIIGMISEGDTLSPVLSERMMNGRTDLHLFTVLFEPDLALAFSKKSNLRFLLYPNRIIRDTTEFVFESKDIIKASKILYDHDEVKL